MFEFKVRYLILGVFVFFMAASSVFCQTNGQTEDLTAILNRADEERQKYDQEFKNLLAREIKTFEIYDKNGEQKKRVVVESDFIVFQSLKDEKIAAEYRSVVKVDDKTVGDTEKRSADLFEQLSKAKSVRQELERIVKENSRYDKNLQINGLTLFQAPVLAGHFRPFFDFRLTGREKMGAADVFTIEYRQTKPSPYVLIEEETASGDGKYSLEYDLNLPKAFNKSNVFMRGKLWIDAQTFQILREERELTAQQTPDAAADPLVVFRGEFDYQPSDFGIRVPQKIAYTYFQVKSKDKKYSAVLDTKAIFEYTNFRKSRVEVKIGDEEGE